MLEGARKYGRHNYRVAGVRASVYVDAAMGHIAQWWEGEDVDPDSGLSHITKALATLVVMRDAMLNDKFFDDRPPKVKLSEIRADLQEKVNKIMEQIPDAKEPFLAQCPPPAGTAGQGPVQVSPKAQVDLTKFPYTVTEEERFLAQVSAKQMTAMGYTYLANAEMSKRDRSAKVFEPEAKPAGLTTEILRKLGFKWNGISQVWESR